MSDGPHRSLPMTRRWKLLAEKAANLASSESESEDALTDALLKDVAVLLPRLQEIFLGDRQTYLFNDKTIGALESLRSDFAGSAVAVMCVDAAMAECLSGHSGDKALVSCVEAGTHAFTHAQFRGMREHYVRKLQEGKTTQRVVRTLHSRLEQLSQRFNFRSAALDLCAGRSVGRGSARKQSGVDQGPPL